MYVEKKLCMFFFNFIAFKYRKMQVKCSYYKTVDYVN